MVSHSFTVFHPVSGHSIHLEQLRKQEKELVEFDRHQYIQLDQLSLERFNHYGFESEPKQRE
jgi:hypothetical protein